MKSIVEIKDGLGNIDEIEINDVGFEQYNLLQLTHKHYDEIKIYHANDGHLMITFFDEFGKEQVHGLGWKVKP